MQDFIEVHEFFVQGKHPLESHVLLHVSEPSPSDKRSKGYFFAVCEIVKGSQQQLEHLQALIDDIESGYYETDGAGGKHPFETTIEYMNRRSHEILKEGGTEINCCIGVLEEDGALLFVTHGQPFGGLFYEKEGELSYVDPFEDADETNEQLFSTVTQGNLSVGQYFLISTPHMREYFSVDRLRKILMVRNVRQNALHIQKVLEQFSHIASFGGCILYIPKKQNIPKTGRQPVHTKEAGSAESMRGLLDQQRKTEETLAPPLFSYLKKNVERLKNREEVGEEEMMTAHRHQETRRSRKQMAESESSLGGKINIFLTLLGKALVAGVGGILLVVKQILFTIIIFLKNIFFVITNYHGQRSAVLNNMGRWFKARKDFIVRLPFISKVLLVVAVIFGITFMGSVAYMRFAEKRALEQETYTNTVQAIKDKKDAAEASLIYHDTNKALTLLQEGKNLLASLPQESDAQEATHKDLSGQLESLLANLRRLTTVSPELLLDVSSTTESGIFNNIEMLAGKVILFGAGDKSYIVFDPVTKESQKHTHETLPQLAAASTPKEEDTIFFVTREATLASYQKDTQSIVQKDISFPIPEVSIVDVFVYNRRLYSLDQEQNQIYKHEPISTGYGKGAGWVKEEDALQNPVSLTIDGDVFVLSDSGEITKFVSGKKEQFSITGLDPALDHPTRIWTYNDVVNLYVLEPTNKRVVVLGKDGKLVQQYTANEWLAPEDMLVDEVNKTIYVLDGNKLYTFRTK